jgi:hypothetical protein
MVVWAIDRPRSAIISRSRKLSLKRGLPPHAQDDDLAVKVPALEQFVQTHKPNHRTALGSPERRRIDGDWLKIGGMGARRLFLASVV